PAFGSYLIVRTPNGVSYESTTVLPFLTVVTATYRLGLFGDHKFGFTIFEVLAVEADFPAGISTCTAGNVDTAPARILLPSASSGNTCVSTASVTSCCGSLSRFIFSATVADSFDTVGVVR